MVLDYIHVLFADRGKSFRAEVLINSLSLAQTCKKHNLGRTKRYIGLVLRVAGGLLHPRDTKFVRLVQFAFETWGLDDVAPVWLCVILLWPEKFNNS